MLTLLDEVLKLKLVFVTGKGGIGKTLIAAALGQYAAQRGMRTLLVESSDRDQLSPLFGVNRAGHQELPVARDLACINLNSTENFREYIVKYLKQKVLYERVFSNRVVKSFLNTVPGLAEVMMLGRLFYTAELAPEPRYDLIIFDGYASGHFLSLMTTPDAVLNAGLAGPLVSETIRVREFLADSTKCGTLFVTVPESLVVGECLDFVPQLLERSPSRLRGLIVNRVVQHIESSTGASRSYVETRVSSCQAAIQRLVAGRQDIASRLDTFLPILSLPELGFVEEPLAADFARMWFQGFRVVDDATEGQINASGGGHS